MLALGVKVLRWGTTLQLFDGDATVASLLLTLLAKILLTLGLALLLEREVELQRQYLWVVLIEVLATSYL